MLQVVIDRYLSVTYKRKATRIYKLQVYKTYII